MRKFSEKFVTLDEKRDLEVKSKFFRRVKWKFAKEYLFNGKADRDESWGICKTKLSILSLRSIFLSKQNRLYGPFSHPSKVRLWGPFSHPSMKETIFVSSILPHGRLQFLTIENVKRRFSNFRLEGSFCHPGSHLLKFQKNFRKWMLQNFKENFERILD